jgi:uncharacterized protein (DUF952 family)
MATFFHIVAKSKWQQALNDGSYAASSIAKEGFIHCSLARQVVGVANGKYAGQKDLVLLEIDESKVNPKVIHEDLYNLNDLYPHIYGPLNLDAVVRVLEFPSNFDGAFTLPKEIKI